MPAGRQQARRPRGSAPRGPANARRRHTTARGRVSFDGRIRFLRVAFVIAFLAIGGKAIALTSTPGNLTAIALHQQLRTVELPAHRGTIVDRTGEELAVGKEQQTVYATPKLLSHPRRAAKELGRALKIPWRRLLPALRDRESGFAYVARKVDPSRARAALDLDLPGVGSYPEEERTYPMRSLAAQVLGFAGVDNRGLAGLELEYDRTLSGRPGSQVVVRDPAGRALRVVRGSTPVAGEDLRLTIDSDIQFTAERVLAQTVRAFVAKGATAIVQDPRTGEILALANVPLLDANHFGADVQAGRNRALTDTYEPGSAFKTFTVAGALADGVVKPGTSFMLQSTIKVGDRIIHEAHARAAERMTVRQILAQSSNVGAVTIGRKMGRDLLLKWIAAFGFGERTGLPFPGEVAGNVPHEWSVSTIGNVPMGQGIAVTPLQMSTAYSAVANDGVLVPPRLVAQVGDDPVSPSPGRPIIARSVARQLSTMLTDVVDEGTGTMARIPGYRVAGKTGTAQKPLANGLGYSKSAYVASFVGFVPAGDPQLVVLVVVDEPHPIWGGVVAAPAFEQIASFALQHLEIAP